MDIKFNTSIESLCKGLPEQIYYIVYYVNSIRFVDKPDYNFIRSNLDELMNQNNFQFDYQYDWMIKPDVMKYSNENVAICILYN